MSPFSARNLNCGWDFCADDDCISNGSVMFSFNSPARFFRSVRRFRRMRFPERAAISTWAMAEVEEEEEEEEDEEDEEEEEEEEDEEEEEEEGAVGGGGE